MRKVFILVFVLILTLITGCNTKNKSNDQNTTPQRSKAAKAMDSDLLPEGGGKKMPMF